jgi:gliding motility-associated peptidyl-prolyl isomerase|tara:strand:- start:1351 stop:1902 length:552 start_codon:yes stop_codon:yes gene_type:complete
MKIKGFFLIVLICFGCSKNEARRPVNPKPSSTLLYETVGTSKVLNAQEVKGIEAYINKDSTQIYEVSENGFWYVYLNKEIKNSPLPKFGDEVILEYNITDLQGTILYSKAVLGIKNYKVDKEDFISGLQKGIKLMKVGETVTFVIPSYHAFGIAGDGNKIEVNQTIKSTVTLLNIKKKKDENN